MARAKPRTPTTTILFLHGCHNLVFITIIFISLTWQRAKPRTLTSQISRGYWFWDLLEPVSGRDCLYRNAFPIFGYYFEEIYLRSLFLIQLHVRGFSSQRITSMIHFLSSVCAALKISPESGSESGFWDIEKFRQFLPFQPKPLGAFEQFAIFHGWWWGAASPNTCHIETWWGCAVGLWGLGEAFAKNT